VWSFYRAVHSHWARPGEVDIVFRARQEDSDCDPVCLDENRDGNSTSIYSSLFLALPGLAERTSQLFL
jgi:hypothetical protein